VALQPEQRLALLQAKLRALVAENWPEQGSSVSLVTHPFMAGSGIVDSTGVVGWVLIDEVRRSFEDIDIAADKDGPELPRGWLGGAIVWATRRGVQQLHVLSEHVTGHDARRANVFTLPVTLSTIRGRKVEPVAAQPFVMPTEPTAEALLFSEMISDAGARPIIDHGVLRAEVLGLEVACVEYEEDGTPYLAVGVGRHDRLAQAMMYGTAHVVESLRTAVEAVKNFRNGAAGVHPANQLAPERWLREIVATNPWLGGFGPAEKPVCTAVSGTEPTRLKRPTPAILLVDAINEEGAEVQAVLAVTVGVDLDAVSFAADARDFYRPNAPLHMVFPESSQVPAMELLCGALPRQVVFGTVPNTWRTLPTTPIDIS
jgi:hypothetical protein